MPPINHAARRAEQEDPSGQARHAHAAQQRSMGSPGTSRVRTLVVHTVVCLLELDNHPWQCRQRGHGQQYP